MNNFDFIKIALVKDDNKRPSKGYAVFENGNIYICGHNKDLNTHTEQVEKKHGMKFATLVNFEKKTTLKESVSGELLQRNGVIYEISTAEGQVTWAFDPFYDIEKTNETKPETNEENKTTMETKTNNSLNNSLIALLQNEVNKQIAAKTAELENEYRQKIESLQNEKKEIKHIYQIRINEKTTKIETQIPLTTKFNYIVELIARKENVYLWGAAGNGKTHTALKAAEALNIPVYIQSAILNDYDLDGYVSADGEYIPSELYKAMTNGGLFILDDFTTGDGRACNKLLDVLANRCHTFPVVGLVRAHEDFRVVATDNTAGNGATSEYNQRDQFDAALLDRFPFRIKMSYEKEIEHAIAPDTAPFCRCFRYASGKIVSYRMMDTLERNKDLSDVKQMLLDTILTKCKPLEYRQYRNRIINAPEFSQIENHPLYKAFTSINESDLIKDEENQC